MDVRQGDRGQTETRGRRSHRCLHNLKVTSEGAHCASPGSYAEEGCLITQEAKAGQAACLSRTAG